MQVAYLNNTFETYKIVRRIEPQLTSKHLFSQERQSSERLKHRTKIASPTPPETKQVEHCLTILKEISYTWHTLGQTRHES